jgi:hypothetical protein
MKSYRAAARVEQNRGAAQALRQDDPALYEQILRQAEGSEAEPAARRDPDAYVALFLDAAEEAGVIRSAQASSEVVPSDHDPAAEFRAHWPQFDVESVWNAVADLFQSIQEERGAEMLYYPNWVVRRFVAYQVALGAARFEPQVLAEVEDALGGDVSLEEDAVKDQRLAAVLRRHHLDGVVEIIVSGLSAEPGAAG